MAEDKADYVGTRLRERIKLETRAGILDSARFLFESKGFAKTTMRGVAEKAGIAPGTIYKYFPSKKELLAEAYSADLEAALDNSLETLEELEKTDIKTILLHIAKGFYDFYSKRPALSREYLSNILLFKHSEKPALNQLDTRFFNMVTLLIKDARESGELGKETDEGLLALAYFSHYLFVLFTGLGEEIFDPGFQLDSLEKMLDLTLSGAGFYRDERRLPCPNS